MTATPSSVPPNTPLDGYAFGEPNTLTAYPNGLVIGSVASNTVIALLTPTILEALQTTAMQLVVAPPTPPKGFGVAIMLYPSAMALQYKFGSTAYTIANADNAFQIEYTGKTTSLMKINATGLVDQTASTVIYAMPAVAGQDIAQTNVAGLGLEVKLTGTTPALTLGNGNVYLTLQYDEVVLF